MLLCRGITTPDGTVLVSSHRHDFKSHTDANGEFYMVDGGPDYLRSSGNAWHTFTVTTDDDYAVIRHYAADGWLKTARLENIKEPWRTKEENYRNFMQFP